MFLFCPSLFFAPFVLLPHLLLLAGGEVCKERKVGHARATDGIMYILWGDILESF